MKTLFFYFMIQEQNNHFLVEIGGLGNKKADLVICKVFESSNSENAVAARSIAADTREVQETLNGRSAHRSKIICEESTKEDSCQVELGVKVQRLIKKVQKYDRDEHKEADAIDPPNRERTS